MSAVVSETLKSNISLAVESLKNEVGNISPD